MLIVTKQVWSFAPPPEDDLSPYASTRSIASSSRSMPAIAPYQDPAYGERPTYGSYYDNEAVKEMVHQQDEVMTDVYDTSTEGDESSAHILEDGDE